MPVWTPEAQLKLLLAVIQAADFKPTQSWPAVAEAMGDGYTKEAVRQQFQKLKKQSPSVGSTDDPNSDAPAPATPNTPAPGSKTPRKRKTPMKMKRDPRTLDGDDEADDDAPTTPTPKKARVVRTPRSKAKGKAALSEEMVQEDSEAGYDSNVKVERMGSDSDAAKNNGNGNGNFEDGGDGTVSNGGDERQLQTRGELLTGAGILSPVEQSKVKEWKAGARGMK